MPTIAPLPPMLRKGKIAEELTKVCRENDVGFLAILGSFARGEPRKKSDIDVLIEYKKDSIKTLFDLVALQHKLRRVFGRKVDLVELGGLRNKYVRQEVLNSMKVIYEER